MKVQLIIPSVIDSFYPVSRCYLFPPLNLLTIATYLKSLSKELEVEILDGNIMSQKDLENRINGQFVGISPTILSYENCLKIAQIAKERGAITVLGGFQATSLGENILRNRKHIDYVVTGDGEDAFSRLVRGEAPSAINNLIYRNSQEIKRNPQRSLNLDALPYVDHGLMNESTYELNFEKKYPNEPFKKPNLIYSQKDCMWSARTGGCVFCGRIDRNWRGRSPENVWDEIMTLNREYGSDYIWDVSGSFIGNRSWFKEFHRQRPKDIPVVFEIYARASEIDAEVALMLHELNCYKVFIGIDSGDPITLKTAGKGSTVGSYALYRLKKNNVAPLAMINKECEPIVAVGAIISDIPCVDKIDITQINTGDLIEIEDGKITITKKV